MSYDIEIGVRVYDTNLYVRIAEPEYQHPTYNLGQMFRAATGWNFEQSKWYRCEEVLPKIRKGIDELRLHPNKYKTLEPKNGWGTLTSAVECLESIRDCLYEIVGDEEIPIEHLWIRW